MRIIVQKVLETSLTADHEPQGTINGGLLALVGFNLADADEHAFAYMADKLLGLRIFEDEEGKLNKNLADIGGSLYLVSNFTLYGDARHGKRPSFTEALAPDQAKKVYNDFVSFVKEKAPDLEIKTGVFQTHMEIETTLSGPVTILLDSDKIF